MGSSSTSKRSASVKTLSDPKNREAQQFHVRDFGYYQNDYELLQNVEIENDEFDEIWEKTGAETKPNLLMTILRGPTCMESNHSLRTALLILTGKQLF